jgi:hypothetical protein
MQSGGLLHKQGPRRARLRGAPLPHSHNAQFIYYLFLDKQRQSAAAALRPSFTTGWGGGGGLSRGGHGRVFAQIPVLPRPNVGVGGKSRDASRPWIEVVEKEPRAEVGVDTLPGCGPLECYEIMYHEIIPFMRKLIHPRS